MIIMSEAIARKETGAMVLGAQYGYTPEYVQLIKDTFAKDATDNELQMFIDVCHHTKLNPMNKEIYFWKQSGKVIIHTGIDGHRLAADRTGRYAPGKTTRQYDGDNHVSSTVSVQKLVAGKWFEIEDTAYMREWKKDSSPFWKNSTTASHQLDITAERHALKKAFPNTFGGLASSAGSEGAAPEFSGMPETASPEDVTKRDELIEALLRIGKLFCSADQHASLSAAVTASALPVLEERYGNALIKLREKVLSDIGVKFQGEAYSAFIVKTLPMGLDAADDKDLFAALDALEKAEVAPTAAETPKTTVAGQEQAGIPATEPSNEAETLTPEQSKLEDLRSEVMNALMDATGGEEAQLDVLLDGRHVPTMNEDQLKRLLARINNDDLPV
jgi:phage recombination protein Bet